MAGSPYPFLQVSPDDPDLGFAVAVMRTTHAADARPTRITFRKVVGV